MEIATKNITGGILAGGEGRRMGGRDKGLVVWQGRPMVEGVIDALQPQVGELLISANRNVERYESYGFTVLKDQSDDYQGPLAGIAELLDAATTEWLLIVPCDMPQLPHDLLERLAAAIKTPAEGQTCDNARPCVAEVKGRAQYCCALLSTSLAAAARVSLNAGELRLGQWLADQGMLTVPCDDIADAFLNMNHLIAEPTEIP